MNHPSLPRVHSVPPRSRRALGWLALALFFLSLPSPAMRAQAPAAATAGSDTVTLSPFEVAETSDTGYSAKDTVSATRTATAIKDLPFSISVVTDQFLSDLGATDIQEALLYENVTTPQTDAFTSNVSTSYIIRGFTAATMHNGFLSAGGSTPVSLMAVDRIEVLKGPASLLYGEMDPGGLVNIVSKRPSSTASTTITASEGSFQSRGGTLDSTGPITKDGRFTYRLLGDLEESEAPTVDTLTQRKELVGMLGGQLTATTDLNVEFDFVHHHVDSPGQEAFDVSLYVDPLGKGTYRQYVLPGEGAPGPSYNYRGKGDYGDGLERYFNAELRQRLGERWNARLAFSNIWDSTGSISGNGTALLPLTTQSITYTYKHGTTVTQGLQGDVTSTWNIFGAELKFLAGFSGDRGGTQFASATSPMVYSFKENPVDPTTYPAGWPLPAPPTSTYTSLTASSHGTYEDGALYTSNMLDLFQKRLHLLAGARVQRVTASAYNYFSKTSAQFAENATSYQGGALYDITKSFGIYASWSQSFNPQNVLLRDPLPIDPATGLPVPGSVNATRPALPIRGEGHDLGFKQSFLNGHLDFTGAYYDVRRSNEIQTREVVGTNGAAVDIYDVQSGTEWSQGVEFGLTGNPAKGVDLMINYNQPFSGILLSDTTIPAYVGKEIQNNPKEQFTFFAKYTWQDGWLNGAFFGLGGRYWGHSSAFAATQPQLATLPPYFVMQAVTGYRWKMGKARYSAQLNVDNLLDRHVLFNAYTYSGSDTYRLTLGVKF